MLVSGGIVAPYFFLVYLLAILLGLCSALIWGAHSSVSMLGMNAGWSSLDLNAARVAGGLLISLPWLGWFYIKHQRPCWKHLLVLSCFAGVPFSLINITGLQFAPITHSAAISLGMSPLLAALFSKPLLGQAISRDHWLALLLLLGGVGTIWVGTPLSWSYALGDLCFLIAAALWGLYGVFLRYWKIKPLQAALYTSLGSAPYLVWYAFGRDWPEVTVDMLTLQLLYQGVIVGVLAVFFYGVTVSILGPQLGTLFSALPPVVVPVVGNVLLGYQSDVYEYIGILLVVAGMLLAFVRPTQYFGGGRR